MKLEVGMYVRTKYGITQYREYEINNCGLLSKIICMPVKCCNEGIFANTEDIVKASHNIIDLIEVGDYVNGELVTSAEDVYTTDNIYIGREVIIKHSDVIIEEEIETIVTREQFLAMEYRLGDK